MLSSQQLISLAAQIAKSPGYTPQAGQILNYVLSELCETYDFEITRRTFNFNFTGSAGPYTLPNDYLRSVAQDVFFVIQVGVPYFMVWASKAEYDRFIQQPTIAAYPTRYWTDMSATPPTMLVWPPPSGGYPVTVSYYSQMPDIGSGVVSGGWSPGTLAPEASSVIPWFPCQSYLVTRVAGELMKITDDQRAGQFLGDSDGSDGQIEGCQSILRKYLLMKDDADNAVKTVMLDRRRFGSGGSLNESKLYDWSAGVGASGLPR